MSSSAALPAVVTFPPPSKPLLRGWSHLVAFAFATIAGMLLSLRMPWGPAAIAAIIYSVSLSTLFGVSALYHRPNWRPAARARMRRLDHSGIVLLIAGTSTPLALVLPPQQRLILLSVIWGCAALLIARALFWISAPKPLVAGMYLCMGWAPVMFGRAFLDALPPSVLWWVAAGGLLYSVGAVCYALKRPKLWPRVFGYHEVFHLLVILAASCHFIAVATVLERFATR